MLEVCVTPFFSSSHETFPEKLICLKCKSPYTSQVLWKAPTSCLTLCVVLSAFPEQSMRHKILYCHKNVYFYPTQKLHLLMGSAPLSFQSKAAWVAVWTGSKDAWKQPPLFSDALNHSFPEESWQIPRLSQIQLCLFRCWLHTQQGQSNGRPASHCILGSATQNKPTQKTPPPKSPKEKNKIKPHSKTSNHWKKKKATCVIFLQISKLSLKGLYAVPETISQDLPSP